MESNTPAVSVYPPPPPRRSVIEKNEDVRPILDAACRWGHHGLGEENIDKQLALLVAADVHGDSRRFLSAVEYADGVAPIDAGLCLGDMAPANFIQAHEWYTRAVPEAKKPWYTVIGNHDGGNSAERRISGTVAEQFDKWIKPTLPKIGDETISTTWYAVRWPVYGVELLVLNCHDVPDGTDEAGNFLVPRGAAAWSQAQIDWLVSELAAVPPGWTVLAAVHDLPNEVTIDPGVWTNPKAAAPVNSAFCHAGLIPDLLDTWMRGAALAGRYKSSSRGGRYDRWMPELTVEADFTARGKGLFAGYLCGHTHTDAVGHVTRYPGQKYYSFDAASADLWQCHDSDLPRTLGTKAEDCLTAAVIDTLTRQVRLVRIGSDFTMNMTRRTYFVGTYGD